MSDQTQTGQPGKKKGKNKTYLYGGIAAAIVVVFLIYRQMSNSSSTTSTGSSSDASTIAADAAAAQAAQDQASLGSGGVSGDTSSGSDDSDAISSLLTQLPAAISSGLAAAYATSPSTGTPAAAAGVQPVTQNFYGVTPDGTGTVTGNSTGQQAGSASAGTGGTGSGTVDAKPGTNVSALTVKQQVAELDAGTITAAQLGPTAKKVVAAGGTSTKVLKKK